MNEFFAWIGSSSWEKGGTPSLGFGGTLNKTQFVAYTLAKVGKGIANSLQYKTKRHYTCYGGSSKLES